jgi:imidazoleglycerol-phosphate dehydratase/histidinol-phosphatase
MKRILFIDRDGTLIREPADEQIDSFAKLEFYPGAITALGKIARECDFELVMVTNQDGLGTPSFPEETFWPVQEFILKTLAGEGIHFAAVHIDHTFPHDKAPTRKPGTALLLGYLDGNYDLAGSYVIGDRISDVLLARNLGCKAILLHEGLEIEADLVTTDWEQVYRYLKNYPRRAEVVRRTRETEIALAVTLDGSGICHIRSGIGFLDHMLELFAKHAGCDLELQARGDLHVDEHHTVEDIALALGDALRRAMGDKRGMERYGFLLPMDESLAQVALDFSGRPQLVWETSFSREKIGEMPTELFKHFFKSFCDTAGANLHVIASGENEHHKIEAIFKSVARAVRQAVARNPGDASIPSSKGVL